MRHAPSWTSGAMDGTNERPAGRLGYFVLASAPTHARSTPRAAPCEALDGQVDDDVEKAGPWRRKPGTSSDDATAHGNAWDFELEGMMSFVTPAEADSRVPVSRGNGVVDY